MSRRYLVTGGAGFIGSWLAEHLHAANSRVTVLDDLSTGREANLAGLRHRPDFRFVRGDTADRGLLDRWTPEGGMELLSLDESMAYDVNDLDQIVGWNIFKHSQAAFLWHNGTLFNLKDLVESRDISHVNRANGINDAGQIAAFAWFKKPDELHGVLLTPELP